MGLSELRRISLDHIINAGLSAQDAVVILTALDRILLQESSSIISETPFLVRSQERVSQQLWQRISKMLLRPDQPFGLHRLLFKACYHPNHDTTRLGQYRAAFYWIPCQGSILSTNYARFLSFLQEIQCPEWQALQTGDLQADWQRLHSFSINHPEIFWNVVCSKALRMHFHTPPRCIVQQHHRCPASPAAAVDTNKDPDAVQWLPQARFNIAECALRWRDGDLPAILWAHEATPKVIHTMTRRKLAQLAQQVADSLLKWGIMPGSNVAINMPMSPESVAAYLGIVLAGCAAVGIAESFSSKEIEARLKIARCAAVFTQDTVYRGGKSFPLYARISNQAHAPKAVVVQSTTTMVPVQLMRDHDILWDDFLALSVQSTPLQPYLASSNHLSAVLFSSGTTGTPKAICWTHVNPLRCAIDAYFHQDVHERDVVCWPTSMGWMMGPWVVYASLMNGAAMALFLGSPLERSFGEFVSAARVTMLGVIPSIVKAWRATNCMEGIDLFCVKSFSSTGEASVEDDVVWLSSRAGYRPVIEYCGGTELAGGYASGSLVHPQAASTFSTPTFGTDLVILLPDGTSNTGEMALRMPMLGASQRLLNGDHHASYYEGMPENGWLRRHGDELEALPSGYYKAHGRVDDTMNLGGVKVSSVELESAVVEGVERVVEAAAVAVPPPGGGPETLVLFVVVVEKSGGVDVSQSSLLLKEETQRAISQRLNPLFKVDRVMVLDSLPRTATNKVMRRVLRESVVRQDGIATLGKHQHLGKL